MLVRELQSGAIRAVCPDHFFGRRGLPAGSPLLGAVLDPHTYVHECEFCALELALPRVAAAIRADVGRQIA